MSQEYIIDGTSIIEKLSGTTSFTPLVQLLVELHKRNLPFYCYFDADTRFKFDSNKEKQLYQNLIKFGLPDYFVQVSGLDADATILTQAEATGGIIVSIDAFTAYREEFIFLQDEKRVLQPLLDGNKLLLKQDGLDVFVNFINTDLEGQLADLVNRLEGDKEHLIGVIDKYKEARDFGFIKRPLAEQKLFFKKEDVADDTLDFTKAGQEVAFEIGVGESGGIYFFCAKNIVKRNQLDAKEKATQLADENKILKASKEALQKQTATAKAKIETQLQETTTLNKDLREEVLGLKEQLELYKSTDNEVIRRLEEQKEMLISENDGLNDEIKMLNEIILQKDREIEALRAELNHLRTLQEESIHTIEEQKQEANELSLTVDVQHDKILGLDDDLRSTLKLIEIQDLEEAESMRYEQLKKDYQILQKSVRQKNSRILFLTSSINDLERQLAYNTSEVVGQSAQVEHLLERIQELERTNMELTRKVEEISVKRKTRKSKPKEEVYETASFVDADEDIVMASKPSSEKKNPKPIIKKIPNDELENWWNGLEEQWKKAFNQGVLSRGEVLTMPTYEQLQSLFERKKIDIVGSGILLYGLNQLSFKLNNLTGLKDLKQITELNLSGHEFTEMEGITELPHLKLLNCTSNKVSTLRNIKNLKGLKKLIIRDNDMINLDGIEELEELEYLNVLYNRGLRTISGVEMLEHLKVLGVPNFKTRIIKQLDKILKQNPNLEVRNV